MAFNDYIQKKIVGSYSSALLPAYKLYKLGRNVL